VCKISRAQAGKELRLTIPLFDGKSYTLSTAGQQVYDGRRMVVRGMGMPIKGGPDRGNLVVDFKITDRHR
jgi:DnaJ-class molecular chaperone